LQKTRECGLQVKTNIFARAQHSDKMADQQQQKPKPKRIKCFPYEKKNEKSLLCHELPVFLYVTPFYVARNHVRK